MIYEIVEVKLVGGVIAERRTVDACARVGDAAVKVVRLNYGSVGTSVRYLWQSVAL